MPMTAFLVRRLLDAAGVMLAVAFLAFLIFRFVGDPVELMLNEQATQAQRDELRVRLPLLSGGCLGLAVEDRGRPGDDPVALDVKVSLYVEL